METQIQHDVVLELKKIIAEKLDVSINIEDIGENISLLEDGIGLDSISIVNFIVNIEERYQFKFQDSQISMDKFKNLNTLSDFIVNQLNVNKS